MNFFWYRHFFACSLLMMIFGCSSTVPTGPKIAVMPAPGKPFDVFVSEDNLCREFAMQSIGKSPRSAKVNAVGTTIAGTAIGSAAGALMGGRQGAATGAGVGLIVGSVGGASQAGYEGHDIQWSYDTAYAQCMYSKGNQVPGYPIAPQLNPPKSK
jgi:uncharacterized protein YcfJ